MAIKLADAVVYLATNDDKLKQGLDAAKQTVEGAANNIGQSFVRGAQAATVAASAAIVSGVIAIGAAAVDVSGQTRQAANDMAASMGIPIDRAQELAEVARKVWGENYAKSVAEAAEAVELINKKLELTADNPALQKAAQDAIALRDVFDADLNESVDAAAVLMEKLGLSADEAFDFIAKGYQKGLNSSDDFIDTIREYGNQFGDAGFSAEQFFSILETGAQGGVLGTDKIADAIKEMIIRLNEGADDTKEAFTTIGLNFDQIAEKVRAGDAEWADYFDAIVAGINSIEDPIARSQAQVAIFGTMAEDLGVSFTEGLSAAKTSMQDMEGAADSLNSKYNTLGDFFSAMWRKVVLAVTPASDKFLELAHEAMPTISAAIDSLAPILTNLVESVIVPLIERIAEWIIAFGKLDPAIQGIIVKGAALLAALTPIVAILPGIISGITALVGAFSAAGPVIAAAGAALAALGGPITATIAIVAALAVAWKTNFLGIRDITKSAMDAAKKAITSAMDGITSSMQSGWEKAKSAAQTAVDGIKSAFQIDWGSIGRGIVDGIANGISSGAQAIVNAATTAANAALDAAKGALGISSPSRRARREIGLPTGEGWGLGILDGVKAMAKRVRDAAGELFPEAAATVQSKAQALANGAGLAETFPQGAALAADLRQAVQGIRSGDIQVVQNFYGPADQSTVRVAARDGLRDALRERGLR